MWTLAILALIFLVTGAMNRSAGLLIPGGILGGIALGAGLIEGPFAGVGDPLSGGIFLLSFAAGWVLITVMSLIFTKIRSPGR
ncbi:MAG: hypothetical protein HC822_10105 [Oscillochloris sp.]|nr:hypothetical protein [Oscillochloris sp.]